MALRKILENWGKKVEGFSSALLLTYGGMVIADSFKQKGIETPIVSAYMSEVIKTSRGVLSVNKWGLFNEVLITSDTNYLLITSIGNNYYLAVTVSKLEGNVGLLRLKIKGIIPHILTELE